MKKIISAALFAVMALASFSAAAQSDIYRASTYWQRLDGSMDKTEFTPITSDGAPCLMSWEGTDPVGTCLRLGTGLSKSSGTLNAAKFDFGSPALRTLSLATAYQATTSTKAAVITASPQCAATLTLAVGQTCILQARVGTSGLTCSTGTVVATWTNGNAGTLAVGLGLTQTIGGPGSVNLPSGAYFIFCQTSGTVTLGSVVDQSAG